MIDGLILREGLLVSMDSRISFKNLLPQPHRNWNYRLMPPLQPPLFVWGTFGLFWVHAYGSQRACETVSPVPPCKFQR